MLGEEEEGRLVVAGDEREERLEAALRDEVGHALAGEVRERCAGRVGHLALGRVLGDDGAARAQRHLREALVDRRDVARAVVEDREEEVDELDPGARVLAQVDEDLLEDVLAERLGEEEEADERRQARLVEELDDLARRRRLLDGGRARRTGLTRRCSAATRCCSPGTGAAPDARDAASAAPTEERAGVGEEPACEPALFRREDGRAERRVERGEERAWVHVGGGSGVLVGGGLLLLSGSGGCGGLLLPTLLGGLLAEDLHAQVEREGVEELGVDVLGDGGGRTHRADARLAQVLADDLVAHVVRQRLEELAVDARVGDVDLLAVDEDRDALSRLGGGGGARAARLCVHDDVARRGGCGGRRSGRGHWSGAGRRSARRGRRLTSRRRARG